MTWCLFVAALLRGCVTWLNVQEHTWKWIDFQFATFNNLKILIPLSTLCPAKLDIPHSYIPRLVNTSCLNISITHQSEFELLDDAEIHQRQQTRGEDTDCFSDCQGSVQWAVLISDLFAHFWSQCTVCESPDIFGQTAEISGANTANEEKRQREGSETASVEEHATKSLSDRLWQDLKVTDSVLNCEQMNEVWAQEQTTCFSHLPCSVRTFGLLSLVRTESNWGCTVV